MKPRIIDYGSAVFRYPAGDRQFLADVFKAYINRQRITRPLIGDWVEFRDGWGRIAHIYSDGKVQVSSGYGSCYLFLGGTADYSGSLCSGLHTLEPTGKVKRSVFWMFYGSAGASRGCHFDIDVKVWVVDGLAPKY